MKTWFKYLKQGLSSQIPQDRIAGFKNGYGSEGKSKKTLLLSLFEAALAQGLLGGLPGAVGFNMCVSGTVDHPLPG